MKRLLILAFALVVVVCLAACTNKNDQNTKDVDDGIDNGVDREDDNDMIDDDDMDMLEDGAVDENNADDDMAHDDDVDSAAFTGSVSAVDGRTIIVKPNDGEDIRSSGDRVSVSLNRDHNFTVGDKVRVTYDGNIMESDPIRVNAINIEEID